MRSRDPRLVAASSCLAVLSLWVFGTACDSDDIDPEGLLLQASCASIGYREVRFRNWDQDGIAVFDAERVCAVGDANVSSPECMPSSDALTTTWCNPDPPRESTCVHLPDAAS